MIHDPADEELYKLKVDLLTGDTETWVLPSDGTVLLDHPLKPHNTSLDGGSAQADVPLERQSQMPRQGFRMTVQPMVEQSFINKYGSNVQTRVNAIMAHAKTFFVHGSLQTKFELDIKPLHEYPYPLTATGSQLK